MEWKSNFKINFLSDKRKGIRKIRFLHVPSSMPNPDSVPKTALSVPSQPIMKQGLKRIPWFVKRK